MKVTLAIIVLEKRKFELEDNYVCWEKIYNAFGKQQFKKELFQIKQAIKILKEQK